VPSGQTLTYAPRVVLGLEGSFLEEYEFDVQGALLAESLRILLIIFRAVSGVPEYSAIRVRSSSTVV